MFFVYLVISCALSAFHLCADDFTNSQPCASNPPAFSTLTYPQASQAVESELKQHVGMGHGDVEGICPEYITKLVTLLRHGYLDNDKEVLAIYLLGQLRPSDTNAITFLIENIDLKALKMDPPSGLARWGEYPAREALSNIGQPAINPLIEALPNEGKELRRQLIWKTLVGIEVDDDSGLKPSEGLNVILNLIKGKIAGESDPVKKANLEAAVKEMEKYVGMPDK
jgi:hypothetical protein